MADATPPNGCQHCGLVQRGHGTRWTPDLGYHVWAAPTDGQRLDRMRGRAAGKADASEPTPELPRGFGRRNPHCSNCGDERGGDFGHEASECRYRSGMTAAELAATMTAEKAGRYWDTLIDRYLEAKLAEVDHG